MYIFGNIRPDGVFGDFGSANAFRNSLGFLVHDLKKGDLAKRLAAVTAIKEIADKGFKHLRESAPNHEVSLFQALDMHASRDSDPQVKALARKTLNLLVYQRSEYDASKQHAGYEQKPSRESQQRSRKAAREKIARDKRFFNLKKGNSAKRRVKIKAPQKVITRRVIPQRKKASPGATIRAAFQDLLRKFSTLL